MPLPPPWGTPPTGHPYRGPHPWAVPAAALRHPLDPDVRTSTKAVAVLVLGLVALLLMFCGGGVVPAAVALRLARSARAEIQASAGFLGGGGALRAGVISSWIALAVSVVVLVAVLVGLLTTAVGAGPEYGEDVD